MPLEQARSYFWKDFHLVKRNARRPHPLNTSPWLAMSLMQKAIRRGKSELALRAAATLLRDSPERFWRRLLVTAFEDVGVADLEVLSLAVNALAGKRWRAVGTGRSEVTS